MYIISIDIGFEHFAMIGANVTPYWKLEEVVTCKLINIKNLVLDCNNCDCKLQHSMCISDYMAHLFHIYNDIFQKADTILIERQPPQGFIAVQELILFKYREKSILLSPNSMHKHFSMSKVQKLRKMFTEKFSQRHLQSFPDYAKNDRKHDMGDAYCQLIYYLNVKESNRRTSKYFTYLNDKKAKSHSSAQSTTGPFNFQNFIYKESFPFRSVQTFGAIVGEAVGVDTGADAGDLQIALV